MKKVISLLMVVLVLAVSLVGCGGGSGIEGKWELAYIEEGDMVLKMNGGATFEIKSDGKLVAVASFMGDSTEVEGTWKADGDKYVLTIDGEGQTAKIDGNSLVVEIDGGKMVFTKDLKNFKYPDNAIDYEEFLKNF